MLPTETTLYERIKADLAAQAKLLPEIVAEHPMRGLTIVRAWAEASSDLVAAFGLAEHDLDRRATRGRGVAHGGGGLDFVATDPMQAITGALAPLGAAAKGQEIAHLTSALARAKDAEELELADRIRTELDAKLPRKEEEPVEEPAPLLHLVPPPLGPLPSSINADAPPPRIPIPEEGS